MPNANTSSTNIIIGKNKIASNLIPTPENNKTAKITIKLKSIFTKELNTYEIGNTWRGKYIFLTKSFWAKIHVQPVVTDELKKIHGTNATNKNK